jgi:hypothetical protein
MPAIAWLLTFTRWVEAVRLRVVWLGVAGYVLLIGVTMVESVTHVSPLGAPVLGTLGSVVGLGAVVASAVVALYGVVYRPRITTSVRSERVAAVR